MNKAILVGNLTKDPELSTTNNGVKFCKFTLAVSRNYSKDGQRETDFLPIIVWRNQAENCGKYLKKGSKCAVVGEIQTRNYEAQDGTRRYVTEIIASEVQFLSSQSETNSQQSTNDKKEVDFDDLKPIDEDLPF